MNKYIETTTQLDDDRDMLVVLQHTEKELLRRIEMNHQDYLYKIETVDNKIEQAKQEDAKVSKGEHGPIYMMILLATALIQIELVFIAWVLAR